MVQRQRTIRAAFTFCSGNYGKRFATGPCGYSRSVHSRRSAVNISSPANGALGERRRHETHDPAPVLEVLEPQPIGSAFEPEIEIPQ
jgi:hypothetical protein